MLHIVFHCLIYQIDDLRRARELSSELTNTGASLYDLLAKELLNKVSDHTHTPVYHTHI